MQIIEQMAKFFGQTPTDPIKMLKWMEYCARTCYRSTDKITEISAPTFVRKMFDSGHTSTLEHSNIVFKIDKSIYSSIYFYSVFRERMAFHKLEEFDDYFYINGNFRAWFQTLKILEMENILLGKELSDLFYGLFPSVFPEKKLERKEVDGISYVTDPMEIPTRLRKYTAKYWTNRAISLQLIRHREDSGYSQESQRYCGYDQLKFGGQVTFIIPVWCKELLEAHRNKTDIKIQNKETALWLNVCSESEQAYMELKRNKKSQEAREVLINSTKTELVDTKGTQAWEWLFKLRTAPGVDPQMIDLAKKARDEFNSMIADQFNGTSNTSNIIGGIQ